MSSRTAFAPSSSSLATAKGTRHPAAIPPDQNSLCKRTSALLELELKLIKSHGQMLAHAPRSPASAVPPSVSSPVPPHRPRATRRLASDTTTHVGVVAAASSASTGNLCSHFGGRRNVQRHPTLAMPSWALSWVLDPDLWMALGCGSSLEASSLGGCERSGRQSLHSASPGPPNAQLML